MADPDIEVLRNAINRLRRWGQTYKWGGGIQDLVLVGAANEALDRIEKRLKPRQVELWEGDEE